MFKFHSLILSVALASTLTSPVAAQNAAPAPAPTPTPTPPSAIDAPAVQVATPTPAPAPGAGPAPAPAPEPAVDSPAPAPGSALVVPAPVYAAPPPAGYAPGYQPAPQPDYGPRPPTGLAGIIVGFAGLGIGVGSLLAIPICLTDTYDDTTDGAGEACAIGQAVVGVGALVVGAVGLSIGFPRRARYKAWRAQQRAVLDGLELAPNANGGSLRYRLTF